MKKIKCYDCEKIFEADTSEEILEKMYPHYVQEHKEIIEGASEEEKTAWMKKFNADWDATAEV